MDHDAFLLILILDSECFELYCRAGFGQGGSEYRQMAGHDSNYIALSGRDDSVLLENHRKTMVKPWENDGLPSGKLA